MIQISPLFDAYDRLNVTSFLCFFVFCLFVHRESNAVLKLENGTNLNVDTFEKNGFNCPILVANKEGLGMVVPDKSFSVMDVERCVGVFIITLTTLYSVPCDRLASHLGGSSNILSCFVLQKPG